MESVKIQEIINENKPYEGKNVFVPIFKEKVVLFLSYDLCNSTTLKNSDNKWLEITRKFYSNHFTEMKFWKYNGDEALYFLEVGNPFQIAKILKNAYKNLMDLQHELQNILPHAFVQGTMWIARISSNSKNDQLPDNSVNMKNVQLYPENSNEYIGPNIDEGFRLTKCTSRGRIAVDPKLVYILLHTAYIQDNDEEQGFKETLNPYTKYILDASKTTAQDVIQNLHFIGYKHLKGIWQEREYPIYWYFETMKDTIFYDDYFDNERVTDILNKEDKSKLYKKSLYQILSDVHVISEVEKIENLLASDAKEIVNLNQYNHANLYYVVVCINPKTGNVLVAQRSEMRKHLRNVWEFGSCKHVSIKDFGAIIEQKYEADFGIQISLIRDKERNGNIRPFAFCAAYRNGLLHNSVQLYAYIQSNIESDEDLRAHILNHIKSSSRDVKYKDCKLITVSEAELNFLELTEKEVEDDSGKAEAEVAIYGKPKEAVRIFNDNSCIPLFSDSVNGAFKQWEVDFSQQVMED